MIKCKRKPLLLVLPILISGIDNAAGAPPRAPSVCWQRNIKRGKMPPDKRRSKSVTAFVRAAGNGETAKVISLLSEGIDINARAPREGSDFAGQTALMAAAGNGHLETVRVLLKKGAEVNVKHAVGGTALTAAAAGGHLEIVKALLAAGADPNIVVLGMHGVIYTGLMFAMRPENKDWLEIVDAMIASGAEINPRAGFVLSPLRLAIEKEDSAMSIAMIKRGSDINLADDETGSTPLMFAARYSSPEVVKALLDAGANINAKNNNGETALAIAMKHRGDSVWGTENIRVLQQNGALP